MSGYWSLNCCCRTDSSIWNRPFFIPFKLSLFWEPSDLNSSANAPSTSPFSKALPRLVKLAFVKVSKLRHTSTISDQVCAPFNWANAANCSWYTLSHFLGPTGLSSKGSICSIRSAMRSISACWSSHIARPHKVSRKSCSWAALYGSTAWRIHPSGFDWDMANS